MKSTRNTFRLLAAIAAIAALDASARAQTLDKFQFRLNWTLYGEHAGFFVASDKGFYKEEGLEVEILEGSGSTTVAQLVSNMTNPVAYVDAATMMRGVGAGMPIKAVGVTLQQSPMAFIYRADAPRPTKIEEIKGSRIAITAGDASLAIFTAFMGKLGMKVDDVNLITVANPQSKEQAVLNKQADALLVHIELQPFAKPLRLQPFMAGRQIGGTDHVSGIRADREVHVAHDLGLAETLADALERDRDASVLRHERRV